MSMIVVLVGVLVVVVFAVMIFQRPALGLYLGVALSGFLMTPDLPVVGTRLAVPDIPLLLALIGLVIALSLSRSLALPQDHTVRSVLTIFIIFLFLAVVSLCINSIFRHMDLLNSLVEVASYIYGFSIAVAMILLVDDWQKWHRFVMFWLIGVAVVSAISVLAVLGLGPEWAHHGGGRIKSTTRAVNQLPSYIAPAIPLLVGLYVVSARNRLAAIWTVPVLLAVVIALSVTGSRLALAMSAFVLVASIIYCARYIRRYPLTAMSVFVISLSVFLIASYYVVAIIAMGPEALPETMRGLVRPIERTVTAASFDEYLGARGEQLGIILNNFHHGLLLGVGPANFMEVFNHRHSVHSTYFSVYIELGLISLVLLLAAMVLLVVRGYEAARRLDDSKQSIMLGMAVIAFLTLCIYGVATFGLRQRIFWLIIGLLLAGLNIAWKERNARLQGFASSDRTA